ncbi:MAG TPA: hypothetical protein VEQ59_16755 [Polyangiaceae bacterium]|nr:hypothetical protein [Polyangiaceae bacterium]
MKAGNVWCWLLLATCSCGEAAHHDAEKTRAPAPALPDNCEPEVGAGDAALLDDFEDGDVALDAQGDFHGLWYVNNDGSGQQSPAADADAAALLGSPGAPSSPRFALHTSGQDFTKWGAFAAVRLNAAKTYACLFDLSSYSGISLSVKGEGALRMNFGTVATTPTSDGGECRTDACSDYGKVVELSSDWQRIDVAFSELSQPSWATTADWDPTRALRVSFWADGADFDFWIDELELHR